MPSGPFAHVCMLVHDLDKAIADWTRILSVLDPQALTDPVVRYDGFSSGADQDMRWATFVANHSAEIQLIQPAPGTPLGDRLAAKGEHVHHLCFTTNDVAGSLAKLAAQGVQVLGDGATNRDPTMTWQEWGWIGPKSAHGVLVEVAAPYESHGDGRWHAAGSRP